MRVASLLVEYVILNMLSGVDPLENSRNESESSHGLLADVLPGQRLTPEPARYKQHTCIVFLALHVVLNVQSSTCIIPELFRSSLSQ